MLPGGMKKEKSDYRYNLSMKALSAEGVSYTSIGGGVLRIGDWLFWPRTGKYRRIDAEPNKQFDRGIYNLLRRIKKESGC